jgi:hypothetical protein
MVKNTYKKITNGSLSLVLSGKRTVIKKDSLFDAFEFELPEAFMDGVVLIKDNNIKVVEDVVVSTIEEKSIVDDIPIEDEVKDNENTPSYKLDKKPRGWFDIIATYPDGTTKQMNEKALHEEDANKMLESLLSD